MINLATREVVEGAMRETAETATTLAKATKALIQQHPAQNVSVIRAHSESLKDMAEAMTMYRDTLYEENGDDDDEEDPVH